MITMIDVRIQDQEAKLKMHDESLRNLEDVTKSTQVRCEENLKRTEVNQTNIAYLKSTIQDMQAMLKEQNAKISELANKLNEK